MGVESKVSAPRRGGHRFRGIRLSAIALGLLSSATASAANHTVNAQSNLTFSPKTLTITAGDTVTFHNNGGLHNVVSNPGAVTSFRCANGCDGAGGNGNASSALWSATVSFPTAGTVGFYCEIHGAPGSGMSGTITVQAATVSTPARNDFNGDGKSDLLWENPTQGAMAYWWMNGATPIGSGVYSVGTAFRIAATGDFNGDGRGDIIWANAGNHTLYQWRSLGNGSFDSSYVASYSADWNVAATADLNGDHKSDLIWENPSQGLMAYWWMNGATPIATGVYSVGTAYRIAATGDLDGDGRGDILWTSTSNNLYLWRSRGDGTFDLQYVTSYASAWNLVSTTDLNGDGKSDLIWENTSQGLMAYWWMNGATPIKTGVYSVGTMFRISGNGDFDGDGPGDILWRAPATSALYLWRSRGDGAFDSQYIASYGSGWEPVP
ncbi:hypothetical protein GCM10027159_14440 [Lysobacter terrae]